MQFPTNDLHANSQQIRLFRYFFEDAVRSDRASLRSSEFYFTLIHSPSSLMSMKWGWTILSKIYDGIITFKDIHSHRISWQLDLLKTNALGSTISDQADTITGPPTQALHCFYNIKYLRQSWVQSPMTTSFSLDQQKLPGAELL